MNLVLRRRASMLSIPGQCMLCAHIPSGEDQWVLPRVQSLVALCIFKNLRGIHHTHTHAQHATARRVRTNYVFTHLGSLVIHRQLYSRAFAGPGPNLPANRTALHAARDSRPRSPVYAFSQHVTYLEMVEKFKCIHELCSNKVYVIIGLVELCSVLQDLPVSPELQL